MHIYVPTCTVLEVYCIVCLFSRFKMIVWNTQALESTRVIMIIAWWLLKSVKRVRAGNSLNEIELKNYNVESLFNRI